MSLESSPTRSEGEAGGNKTEANDKNYAIIRKTMGQDERMSIDLRVRLIRQINVAFTPGAPIDSKDLFAGRMAQVQKVLNVVFQKGTHAVLFGERGVGKTSLTNIIFDFLVFSGMSTYYRARTNCNETGTFDEIWRFLLRQFTFEQPDGTTITLDMVLPEHGPILPENIREALQLVTYPTLVIIDELDGITDRGTRKAIADTIKTLSDNAIDTTVLLVGVAESVDQLIGEHPSIERALREVPMPRMSKNELLEIIDKGVDKCEGLHIEDDPRGRIADYSQGLPYYTHLLAREAAINAIQSDRFEITKEDLQAAIREAVDSHLGTNLTLYNKATTAARGIYFKPVLLACALAPKDEKGFFYAKDVVDPLRILTRKSIAIEQFAQHLRDFSTTRGPILERDGRRYRFIKPMMEPYVTLRGLADGLINDSQLSRPSALSTEPEQLFLLSDVPAPPLKI
ncbi:MAG TPA: AAA family ATPase [Terracidiphilus sp.]|nr:AAA family ATPase [Terracidiphilus sp.]